MVSPLDELPQALAAQVQTRSNTVRPTKRECSVNLSLISGPQSRTIGRRILAPNDARSSTQHQLLHSTNFYTAPTFGQVQGITASTLGQSANSDPAHVEAMDLRYGHTGTSTAS